MSDITTLAGLLELVRTRIEAGLHDRDAAARLPVLATRDAEGWPSARSMVLRDFDPGEWTLDIHSDADAAKVLQFVHAVQEQYVRRRVDWIFRARRAQ